jgi:NACHT domain
MQTFPAPPQNTLNLIVVTAVLTTLVALLINKFFPAIGNLLLRPCRRIGKALYRRLAPRNPLSMSLRSYKKHIARSALSQMENPVGPAIRVPLQTAFAPLKIVSESSPQGIELFSYASKHQRFIVLGGPGTGKTTLMKSLVVNVLNESCHPSLNRLVPAFVVLRKLSSKTIKEAIVASFADYNFSGAADFIDASLSQGRMLIVLDGLDEVAQNRSFVVSQIQDFCSWDSQNDDHNWIVVTCRENSYRTEDLRNMIPDKVRVEPFANHHMRVFLEGWPAHKDRAAIGLYSQIQNDAQIRDACRNPPLLTILTGLYLDSDEFELPSSRGRFYAAAVDELLIKRPSRRNIRQSFPDREKRRVLDAVSLERLEDVLPQDDPEQLTFDDIRSHALKSIPNERIDEFVSELVEVNGIIKQTGERVYTTSHRTFQEYFAAREAERIRNTNDVLERFANRNRTDLLEVLYFYCGLLRNLPQLQDIVEHLSDAARFEVAGRCLLNMAEPLPLPVVEKVVKGLFSRVQSGDWQSPTSRFSPRSLNATAASSIPHDAVSTKQSMQ